MGCLIVDGVGIHLLHLDKNLEDPLIFRLS